jgi:hypothetical protein
MLARGETMAATKDLVSKARGRLCGMEAGSARTPPPLAQARTSPNKPWGRLKHRFSSSVVRAAPNH